MSSYQEKLHNEIFQTATKCGEVQDYMRGLILPYNYFKKLNILPLEVVEGEMDKYFNIRRRLLEQEQDEDYVPRSIRIPSFWWFEPISQLTMDNFYKYHNNLPKDLITTFEIKKTMIKNLDRYEKIIDNEDLKKWCDYVYNNVEIKYQSIRSNLKKKINELKDFNINKRDLVPVEHWRDGYMVYTRQYPDGVRIVKNCSKIIKVQFVNQLPLGFKKIKQFKKEKILVELCGTNTTDYQVRLDTGEGQNVGNHVGILQYKSVPREDDSGNTTDIWVDDEREIINFRR